MGLVRDLQCPVDSAGNGSLVGNAVVAVFQIPKIGVVCACSNAATCQIAKGMVRGDLAHRICLGRYLQCPVDCASNASRVGNAMLQCSRLAMFMLAVPQPLGVS